MVIGGCCLTCFVFFTVGIDGADMLSFEVFSLGCTFHFILALTEIILGEIGRFNLENHHFVVDLFICLGILDDVALLGGTPRSATFAYRAS